MNNDEIVPGFDSEEDKALRIRLQRINDRCLVLYLDGRIDTYSSNNVQKRFNKAIEKGFMRMIIDARGLNYVSSAGVGILVHLMKTLNLRNGDVVFMHFQPTVWQVLELLGLARWFTIAEDLDEAIHSFNGSVKDWPIVFKCPICEKRLKAVAAGRFRCGECRTILVINNDMQVLLG